MSKQFMKIKSGINLGNLSADPSDGANGDTYYNTVSNTQRVYVNGGWTDAVTTTGTQNLTNKTIGVSGSGLLGNTLQYSEITTPSSNPPTGVLALYPKNDGNFYSLNSAGSEIQIGGSSGGDPIGAVKSAFLTLAQFQSQMGTGWVLSQGQTVSGSSYEAITGNSSAVLSLAATTTATNTPITFSTVNLSTTGNTTNGSNIVNNLPISSVISAGQIISGNDIPYNATVSNIYQYLFTLPGTANGYSFAVHSSTRYIFTVTAANATAGAVYHDSSNNPYTVVTTIAGGTTLITNGTVDPATTSGTLTLFSGTGDATIAYSAYIYGGANATAGATYTNNGQTFTVGSTITGGITLTTTGTGIPAASGTLTLASGTGDSTISFTSFTYLGHNATAGATYTNNGQTFTVVNTIADDISLLCTGTGIPAASGTLTLASGTGDSTISFTSATMSVQMSQMASGTTVSETIKFSTFATSATANLTASSATISAISSTVGIATGQVVSSQYLPANTLVNSISVTTVPDCRGLILRGKNNGRSDGQQNPDGDLALGTYQADAYLNHTHTYAYGNTQNNGESGSGISYSDPNNLSRSLTTGSSGGNETRGKNITINHFIRIN